MSAVSVCPQGSSQSPYPTPSEVGGLVEKSTLLTGSRP
jgi:hypothetical protein